MALKEKILKDTVLYTLANNVAMAVGIIMSVATKAMLGAVGAGYWALFKVFLSYGEYSDLGTRDALSRELPQAEGAVDSERVRRVRNAAFSFTLAASLFSAGLFLLAALFIAKNPTLRKGLVLLAFLVVSTQMYNYALVLLRALKKVNALSALIVINVCLAAIFSVAGAWWKGVLGMAAGFLLSTVTSAWLGCRLAGVKPVIQWEAAEARHLLKIGLPMVLLSYALITFLSVDVILISRFLSVEELGYYTISLMAVQQVSSLGRFAHIVVFPHIQECYGRSGSIEESKVFFVRGTRALAYFLPIAIAMVFFLVPLIVHAFLPRFEPGLPAMKVLLLGYFFMAVNEMSSTILFTINRQIRLIPIYASMIVAALALNFLAIRADYGIEGIAAAMAVSYFLFFSASFFYSFSQIMKAGELRRFFGSVVALFVYFAVLALAIDRWVNVQPFYAGCLLKTLCFFAGYLPALWPYERREKVLGSLFSAISLPFKERLHA